MALRIRRLCPLWGDISLYDSRPMYRAARSNPSAYVRTDYQERCTSPGSGRKVLVSIVVQLLLSVALKEKKVTGTDYARYHILGLKGG